MNRKYFNEYKTNEIDIDDVPLALLMNDNDMVEILELDRNDKNIEIEVKIDNYKNKFKIENKSFTGPEKLNLNIGSVIKENFENYFLEMSDNASLSISVLIGLCLMTGFFSAILSFVLQKTFLDLYLILLVANILLYLGYYFIKGRKESINGSMYNFLIFFILLKINDVYYHENNCNKKKREIFSEWD